MSSIETLFVKIKKEIDRFEFISNSSSKVYLSCSTCENAFDSPVQFGKHLCEMLPAADDNTNEFNCESCDKKLTSRNR